MHISKKNEVYLIVEDLELHEKEELSSFFTFEVPGFKFMPMYRNRMWDGKIRLFSQKTKEIYFDYIHTLKHSPKREVIILWHPRM